jgi:hypothetical protein
VVEDINNEYLKSYLSEHNWRNVVPTASQKKTLRKYIMENNLREKAEMDPSHE